MEQDLMLPTLVIESREARLEQREVLPADMKPLLLKLKNNEFT
jgi:hypothetical protein